MEGLKYSTFGALITCIQCIKDQYIYFNFTDFNFIDVFLLQ